MARILWTSEIKEIFGSKTKSSFIEHARENLPFKEIRPAVIKALRGRPQNSWEDSFWRKFDGERRN